MHTFIKNLLNGQSVEWKTLGEVSIIKTGQSVSKQKILDNQGIYPVINSGKEPLGYIDEWNTENDPIGITSRGAGVGSIIWQEGKYFRGNLNYSTTVKDKEILNVRFLYYVLVNFQKTIHSLCTFTGIPALNASELKKLIIPVPPLPVQQKIVQILDTFTATTAELTAEHNLRVKQYQYYRGKLLNFSDNVEWKSLGEVAIIKTGQSVSKQKILDNQGVYPVINSGREPLGFVAEWNADNDPIGITTRGAGVGSVTWQEGRYFRGNLNYSVTIKNSDELMVRFLYHILLELEKEIHNLCTFTGIPALNSSNLKSLKIPIPPLEIQTKIVEILDKFEMLTHSISEGLPREIELRQKQYEYYRALLLGFE